MTRHNPHIAIIGAGPGGLCLAQGLKRQGLPFTVYERDSVLASLRQGYRIRLDATGQQALAACLPPALYGLLRDSCALPSGPSRFLDPQLETIAGRAPQSWGEAPPHDHHPASADLSANRLTLREVMMRGIEEHLHLGKAVTRVEEQGDGPVLLHFADGSRAMADLVVAADGANSLLRGQKHPDATPQETGSLCLYGKTRLQAGIGLDPRLLEATSVIFADHGAVIVDPMRFRFPDAAHGLSRIEDYLYWAIIGEAADLAPDGRNLAALEGVALQRIAMDLARDWAKGARALFSQADPDAITARPIRSAPLLMPCEPSRLTFLGDAIHVMSPAGGLGANTALEDAACLAEALASLRGGTGTLLRAVGDYEADMRIRANSAITASRRAAARLFNHAARERVDAA